MALVVSFGTPISLLVVFLVNMLSTDAATLGQACNNTNTCTGNHVVCSNTRNICDCDTGYQNNSAADACVVELGNPCPSGTSDTCSVTNAVCTQVSSGSPNYTCQCTPTYYKNGITCEPKKNLGYTCSLSLTVAQCADTNAECAVSSSSATCQCKSGFFDNNGNDMGGTCEAKKDLGYTCSLSLTVAQCSDTNAECAGSSSSGTCQCKSGFFDNNGNNLGGTCEAKKGLEYTCSLSLTVAQCADTNAECAGSSPSGSCQCKSGFFDNNGNNMGGTCEEKKDLGYTCSLSLTVAQCADTNAECAGSSSSGSCQCKSDFFDTNGNDMGGTCEAKVGLGSACPKPNACSTTNAVCSNSNGGGICVCGNGYYDNNGNATLDGTCSTKVGLGSACPQPDACNTTNAICSNPSGGGTCICGNGFYDSNGNTTSDGSCSTKVVLGLMCPQPDACSTTNAVCSNPNGVGTCVCGNGYYDSNGNTTSNGTCLKKVPLGSQCTMSTACATTNSVCGSSTCQCSSNFYDDNGANPEGNCENRIILNNQCNSNAITSYQQRDQCQDGNAECSYINAHICTCKQGYHSVENTCVADKPLGGSCNYREECSDRNAQCTKNKCTCDISYYVSNDGGEKCMPVSNLAVTDITFSAITNTSITVHWSLPEAASYINVLVVSWRPSTGTGQTVTLSSSAQTSYTISSHIEPGRAYMISITSRNTMTEIGSNRETVSTGYQAAKPNDPTGPLQLTDLDASDRQITIGWPIVPYFSGFDVSLMGGSLLVEETTHTAPWRIYNMNILNGYRYNVTLRTRSEVSGNNPVVFSGTYREQIKTKVQEPDPPMSAQCTTGDSYSISLTWLPPSYPNGDLVQYHIEVYALANPNNALSYHSTGNISTMFTVSKLQPGFTYLFKIRTENEMYNSTRSLDIDNCTTTARKSGEPTNLTVTEVTSRSMHVSWDYPEKTNSEEISGYILQIKDNSGSCVHEQLFICQGCSYSFQNPAGVLCADNVRQPDKRVDKEQLSKRVTYNVTGLLPDIEYSVSVSAVNQVGQGNISVFVQRSDEEEPQMPTNISATDIQQRTMIVKWILPHPRPGSTTFTITLIADSPAEPSVTSVRGFEIGNVIVHNLEEFWTYSVSVTATTSKGSKTANSTAKYTTKPDAPGPVGNFTVVTPGNDVHKLKASWMIPPILQRNSNITGYVFVQNVSGTESYSDVQFVSEAHVYEEMLSVIPENFYVFKVYAKNQEGKNGTETRINMEAPAGVPYNEFEMGSIKVIPSAPAVSQTTVTIVVKQDFLRQSKNGQIRLNGLIGCEHSKCNITGSSMNKAEFEKMRTYNEASKKGFIPYRITKDDWGKSGSRKRRALEDEITFTVGTEICDSSVTTYCNGPLPPDTSFSFIVVTCTNGGCLLSGKYGPYRTAKEPDAVPVGAIIGGVVGGVAALVIISIIIGVLMYRKRNQGPGKMTKIVEDAVPNLGKIEDLNISRKRPVKLSEFEAHLKEMHKDTNLQFSAAYEDLKAISPRHSQNAANEEDNKMKNRYINILPFDHSRVKLSASGEDTKEDYINANYLPGYRSPREYIGCQGPLPGTIDDFWRMVWEQNVSVVVMLTLCKEQQKVKCEQYWPDEVNDPKQFGDVVVEVTSYSSIKTYDFRVFKLVCNGRTRILKHFHFLTWLDFQANVQHEIIIDFITQVRSHVQPPDTAGPMIIHCSAGVGRTGTYIILDHLMQYMDDHDFEVNIDIFDMVLKLRENRPHMVQTEQQFVFIHDCVKVLLDKKRIAMAEQNNIYENRAFDTKEDNIYQNQQELTYENVQMKTEL